MSVIIFRQDTKNRKNASALRGEILKGRLRQGWSWHSDMDLNRGIDAFASIVQANPYSKAHPISKQDAEAIFRKVAGMLAIRPGDLLIVPHQPQYDQCTAMVAALGSGAEIPYRFIEPIASAGGLGDFRHVIDISPTTVKVFSRESAQDKPSVDRAVWGRGGYAGPVNFVKDVPVAQALLEFVGS